jgi:hypothetical protein
MKNRTKGTAALLAIAVQIPVSAATADQSSVDNAAMAQFSACQTIPVAGLGAWLAKPIHPARELGETTISYPNRGQILTRRMSERDAHALSWEMVSSQQKLHQELWAKAGMELPTGGRQLRILRRSDHWSYFVTGYLAVQSDDKVWAVTSVSVNNYGSEKYEKVPRVKQYRLSEADSSALDALLDDPCLKAEPTAAYASFASSSEYPIWTLETSSLALPAFERANEGFGRTALIYNVVRSGDL